MSKQTERRVLLQQQEDNSWCVVEIGEASPELIKDVMGEWVAEQLYLQDRRDVVLIREAEPGVQGPNDGVIFHTGDLPMDKVAWPYIGEPALRPEHEEQYNLEECVENDWQPPYYHGPWTVAIYLEDRAYGGPEEGGWYYTCGTPCTDELMCHQRSFMQKTRALDHRRELEQVVAELNMHRRPISSVLSQGLYAVRICQGIPKHYPQTRPRYE